MHKMNKKNKLLILIIGIISGIKPIGQIRWFFLLLRLFGVYKGLCFLSVNRSLMWQHYISL